MLAESLDRQMGQQQDAPALPGLDIARGPDGAVDRDGAGVEVNLVPLSARSSSVLSPVVTDSAT